MENIEVKKWEEYTPEEKSALLNHWFTYYGGMLIRFDELCQFYDLAKTRQDEIFASIMLSLIANDTMQSNYLLTCMRGHIVDILFDKVKEFMHPTEDLVEICDGLKDMIVEELVKTYNNPEPAIPLNLDPKTGKPRK